MLKMTITDAEAELMLRLLRTDDANNRENDLEREPEFEELEAKLVCVLHEYAGRL
jgi:hypothetical protein